MTTIRTKIVTIMRRILVCSVVSLLIPIQSLMAQSQVAKEMSDYVTLIVGSFMDNPAHHSNTLKIYDLTQKGKKLLDDMNYTVPPSLKADINSINNMQDILRGLDFLTANIVGRSRGGLDALLWETYYIPILNAFGWDWKVIFSTSDIIFYEYIKDDFKMVLAKNIRPKKDGGDYNAISFSCYTWQPVYKQHYPFTSRVVFGGNYQFVEFCDDETEFVNITKVSSKRENK